MSPLTSIILLVVLIAVWVLYRARSQRSPAVPHEQPVIASPGKNTEFHAVSIKALSSACDAAKSLTGQRFLSSEAPFLPLQDCDVVKCKCRFVHYRDRRTGEDRRDNYGRSLTGGTSDRQQEQRKRGERRDDAPDEY